MNPLILTLTFLTLIGVLTSSELLQRAQGRVQRELVTASSERGALQQTMIARAEFDDLKLERSATPISHPRRCEVKKSRPSRSTPLHYNWARPPNNSRLNFFPLIQQNDEFCYQTAATLIRNLYGECSYFIPHVEYRLLDALMKQQSMAIDFESPDELATLDLGDRELQQIFYRMLKGEEAPSLLLYITYDSEGTRTQKKINLLFASPELIRAIFDGGSISDQIIALVDATWNEIESFNSGESLTRTAIRQQLAQKFESLLERASMSTDEAKKRFDFTLGKSGTILLIEDPKTGTITRQKLTPRSR